MDILAIFTLMRLGKKIRLRHQIKDAFALNPQETEALAETRRIICQAKLVSRMNLFVLLNFDMFILLVILL